MGAGSAIGQVGGRLAGLSHECTTHWECEHTQHLLGVSRAVVWGVGLLLNGVIKNVSCLASYVVDAYFQYDSF